MGEMEELNGQFGKFRWKRRGSNIERVKKILEPWPWFWTWRRPSSGRRTSASQGRSCECYAGTSSAVSRMRGGAAPDHHGHSLWVQVELLALAHYFAGRAGWGDTIFTASKMKGVCG